MLGYDFKDAMTRWLYPVEPLQTFWRGLLLALLLFGVFTLLQIIMGLIVFGALFHGDLQQLGNDYLNLQGLAAQGTLPQTVSPVAISLLKSTVIGIFPAGLVTAFLAVYFSRFGRKGRQGHLPLEWPRFGPLGWFLVVVAFAVIMAVGGALLFAAFGVDPSAYQTSGQGLGDLKSQAGLVEKTLAELARDPWMFALALPSVVLAAPLAEELIFRGVLFAALTQSYVGRPGAVIITAALWSVAHAGAAPGMFIGIIFLMGLVLGVLLLRFGSLWITIACHTAWNTLVAVQMLALGGHS